jgi:predicted permease
VGRLFTAEDGRPGFTNMTWPIPVLLSHELWQRRYAGAPDIIGRTITLNERPRPIVGVLPQGFAFPRVETQIWMLFMPPERTSNFARDLDYSAIARLHPGVTTAAAAAELERILPSIEGVYADATAARLAEVQLTPLIVPLKDALVGDVRPLLLLLFGGMAVLLLVACANTANLSLLRAEHRRREMAVRTALGARTADLVRLCVSEAALVSAAGTAFGLWLADLALKAIVLFTPVRLPRLWEVTLDIWVLAFSCGLAALGTVLFSGVSFLRQSVLISPAASLRRSAGTAANGGGSATRDVLVAVQVALALTLLAGSTLMVQSFWRLMRVDPGFDPAGVLTVEIGLPGRRASQHQRIYDGLLQQLSALPGVRAASAASSLPLDRTAYAYPLSIDGAPGPTELPIAMKFIMPGYFQVMEIPVIEGTGFAHDERADPPDGVIVSASFARRRFPGRSPIGRQILRHEPDGTRVEMFDPAAGTIRTVPPWTIVGVVADVRETSLRADPTEMVYIPVRRPAVERSITPTSMSLVIRSDVPPASLAGDVRHAIREADAALSVARIRPMDAIVTTSIASERFLAGLLLVAAAVSLLLSAIGVYGVAAQTVRRREHEIGIRMSLGAGPREVVVMVLKRSTAFVLIGAAAGLAAALGATRALTAFLFQVRPTDPLVLGMVTALLIAVAVIAVLVPARRAVRLDPLTALRRE